MSGLISFTVDQLFSVGLPLGHTFLNSEFLATWCVNGWRTQSVFEASSSMYAIMDLYPTLMNAQLAFDYLTASINSSSPVWYISQSRFFGSYLARYAVLCGETYSVYKWVPGCVTNAGSVYMYYFYISYYWSAGMKVFHSHSHRLLIMAGINYSSGLTPGFLYIPRTIESFLPMSEAGSSGLPTASLIDSNIISSEVTLPMPGNDDSMLCINFFTYVFSRSCLELNSGKLINWNYSISHAYKRDAMMSLALLIMFYNDFNDISSFESLGYYEQVVSAPLMSYSFNFNFQNVEASDYFNVDNGFFSVLQSDSSWLVHEGFSDEDYK